MSSRELETVDRHCSPLVLRAVCAAVCAFSVLVAGTWAAEPDRGRLLLLRRGDVARMRAACGLEKGGGSSRAHARTFQALRHYYATRPEGGLLPGEALGAAFLHLVAPEDPRGGRWLRLIERALAQPVGALNDPLELVIALDWCWDAVSVDVRERFLRRVRDEAALLTSADSPLDARAFHARLTTLAAAMAGKPGPTEAKSARQLRKRTLAAAREYFESTFPTFLAWRGRAPTSPTRGPAEERDAALALELASEVVGADVWDAQRDGVGRWLEHYVYASFSHPALQHHYIRDDGTFAPLNPAPRWEALLPLTAHLIAARTGDPSAALVARRVEQRMRGPTADPRARPWQWVSIAFDVSEIPVCDLARLPLARNLGGAVALRARWGDQEAGVWIEAGQPLLRDRQHADAGHFLIYGGGQLTADGGDDITFEAVPSKQGAQHLGADAVFDFENYFTATIAHNALLVWDPVRIPARVGRSYRPAGGQRHAYTTCTEFAGELRGHSRETGRLVGYGMSTTAAYVALDLAPAYDSEDVRRYTREFILFDGSVLVVVDRVELAQERLIPIWVLNLPARPGVAGAALSGARRVAGSTNRAGIWEVDAGSDITWSERDGRARLVPLLPRGGRLIISGGPAEPIAVASGRHAGRSYVGSSAEGFERLVEPALHAPARNAWYRLGSPTVLGPAFGRSPHWGRVEVEPREHDGACVFVNVLLLEMDDQARPPKAALDRGSEGGFTISVDSGRKRAALRIPAGGARGGRLESGAGTNPTWRLPDDVVADKPLATD